MFVSAIVADLNGEKKMVVTVVTKRNALRESAGILSFSPDCGKGLSADLAFSCKQARSPTANQVKHRLLSICVFTCNCCDH